MNDAVLEIHLRCLKLGLASSRLGTRDPLSPIMRGKASSFRILIFLYFHFLERDRGSSALNSGAARWLWHSEPLDLSAGSYTFSWHVVLPCGALLGRYLSLIDYNLRKAGVRCRHSDLLSLPPLRRAVISRFLGLLIESILSKATTRRHSCFLLEPLLLEQTLLGALTDLRLVCLMLEVGL